MTEPPGRQQTKPFAQLLQEMNRGRLHAELSDACADVIGAVVEHGKKGSLTIKLDISPEGDEAVKIAASYSPKPPQPPAKPSLFFADAQGHVSRQRLNQLEMPLRGVEGGAHTDQDGGVEAAQA